MKYILPLSVFLSLLNLYISFFLIKECTVNEGVVFGIDIPYPEVIGSILLLIVLFISLKVERNMKYIFTSIAVMGLGNLLERTVHGYICDYINIFNISVNIIDICITILVVLGILICVFQKDENRDRRER